MKQTPRFMKFLGALILAAGIHPAALAQAPNGAVSIIVPQPAGNSTDGVARRLQPQMQKALGQTVIVENAPGAGGSIGLHKVLAAEGLAVAVVSQTEPILTPMTIKQVRYKAEDFQAVAVAARLPYILAARPNLPANTQAELMELTRKSQIPLSFGNIGPGSMIHLMGEEWSRKTGVALTQVSYKGVVPVAQDLMSGQIDLTFLPLGGATLPMIQSGKVKAIATTGAAPPVQLPNLQPISQSEKKLADFVYGTWIAVLVPAKVPAATVGKLNKAAVEAMKDPEFQSYVTSTGMDLVSANSLADASRFYREETKYYQALARRIGVKAE